jgi:hypothetical protein
MNPDETSEGAFREGEPPPTSRNETKPPGLLFKIFFWTIMAIPCVFVLGSCLYCGTAFFLGSFFRLVGAH